MVNINLFENMQIWTAWNEIYQKWYFSVQNVVRILTDSTDVEQNMKNVLSRDDILKSNWNTIWIPVEKNAAVEKNIKSKQPKLKAS